MSKPKITVEAVVSVPAGVVWNHWNEPEHITKWNFASDDWWCPRAENDLRVGGSLVSRMEAKDGSFGFDFEATYTEVKINEKIAYRMGDGRHAVTSFEDLGDKTRVTTEFEAEGENPVEMQKAGWQAILDNFVRYTEADWHKRELKTARD